MSTIAVINYELKTINRHNIFNSSTNLFQQYGIRQNSDRPIAIRMEFNGVVRETGRPIG